jgi:uncharacterized protein YndB with AHSA1/START domain
MATLTESYATEFTVDRTPEEVFVAVTDVRAWFSKTITGDAAEVGDEFHFADSGITSSRIRIAESVPGRRVVWHVEDAYLAFIDEHDEWTGTSMTFEITPTTGGTTLRFTHEGLTPASVCYGDCSQGWDGCVSTSLHDLITSGTGRPITE